MTPKVTQAVDPIFLYMLNLLDRISAGEEPSPHDERLRIRGLLDQAEALVGAGTEWELAKYALVSWIDEMLVDAPWRGADWWSNNVLEVELFNSRLCYEQFYVRAQQASSLSRRDSLEVFYICVVLGFRGLYRDPVMGEHLIQAHGLPSDLDQWAKQTALAIRLGQGRPPLSGPQRELAGAPPLISKDRAVWAGLALLMAIASNAVVYRLFIAN